MNHVHNPDRDPRTTGQHPPPAGCGRTSTIPEVGALSGVSERHLWRLVSAGKIRVIRFGRRVVVPHDEVERLLSRGTD